jgi:hypothetical protein
MTAKSRPATGQKLVIRNSRRPERSFDEAVDGLGAVVTRTGQRPRHPLDPVHGSPLSCERANSGRPAGNASVAFCRPEEYESWPARRNDGRVRALHRVVDDRSKSCRRCTAETGSTDPDDRAFAARINLEDLQCRERATGGC